MCGRPMNLGLSPSSVPGLNESFHHHACYSKRSLSFLETLRFKVRRTWKDHSKEMCYPRWLRDFSYRKAFPEGRWAVDGLSLPCEGPFHVPLIIHRVIRVKKRPSWVYTTHVKPALQEDWTAAPSKDVSRVSDIGTEFSPVLIVGQTVLFTAAGIWVTLRIAFTNKHVIG